MAVGIIIDREIIVQRFDPDSGEPGRKERFTVPLDDEATVLQALQYIYENLDPTLAFEYACRYGRCGLCAVEVNGRPLLACTAFITKDKTAVAPLSNLPVIRDLQVDRGPLEKLLISEEIFFCGPGQGPGITAAARNLDGKQLFPPVRAPADLGRILRCIECLCCHAACPRLDHSPAGLKHFAGPYVFIKLAQLHLDPRDLKNRKAQARALGIEQCSECRRCTCPQGIPLYRMAIEPLLD